MIIRTFPIGIFDSGVGGLSVLRAIRAQMPNESVIYFGDQGHIPYGPRCAMAPRVVDRSTAHAEFVQKVYRSGGKVMIFSNPREESK